MPVKINGATSGSVTLAAPATGSDVTLSLPSGTGTIATTSDIPTLFTPVNGSASIATSQSKSGGSYEDLATPGPIVTLVTGTRALVICTSFMTNDSSTGYMDVGVSVSGATTLSAVGVMGIRNPNTTTFQTLLTGHILLTGLTAGTNVFKMQYSAGTGTATFATRRMTVIDMGS